MLLGFYRVLSPFDDDLSQMRIRFVVERAIVERGWSFSVSYDASDDKYWGTVDRDDAQKAVTPAHALLSAYVKVLEAVSGDRSEG